MTQGRVSDYFKLGRTVLLTPTLMLFVATPINVQKEL